MSQFTLVGAQIICWINNKMYNVAQSVSFTVDYDEQYLYGIDSPFAQEIVPGKVSVTGTISGIRIRNSGGIQAVGARSLIADIIASPYISIRIQDRISQEDILYVPQAKVSSETHSAQAKQKYGLNLSFKGLVPEFALDRQSSGSSGIVSNTSGANGSGNAV